MIETLELLVSALICIEIALICIRYADKEGKIVDKLSKIDTKNAKEIVQSLLESQQTRDFLFDVAYNLLSHANKADMLKPYMDEFYNTLKGHVLSSGGHSKKLRKQATKEVVDAMIAANPIGQYATLIIGTDQIHEFLGVADNPAKALEKIKVLASMFKEMPKGQLENFTQQ